MGSLKVHIGGVLQVEVQTAEIHPFLRAEEMMNLLIPAIT